MASVHHEPVPQLRDVQARAPLGAYLRSIHDRRAYIWNVAVNELRHRQITNVLGNLWHLLNPALTIGVYYLIFGLLLETDRGVDNFLLFITVGLFIFQFTQKGTTEGAKSIVTNMGVIKAVNFPRALLWLGVLPLIGVQFVFTLGCALIAARLTTHFIDTLQILPFVFRLILYASGVIFSVDAYVDQGGLAYTLFVLNPVYCYISIARWSVIGTPMRDELIVSGTIWAFVTLVVGLLWFRANEERYARD
jgi:teichoic acid transport system permease protein